jgi:oxalate decarboxylase/phosphoglucose isomerase-like protein (cupin superfamily)
MQSFFSLKEILSQRLASDSPYLEFLRVPAMSSGLYVLSPGAQDAQTPHAEDEIYFVVAGSARMSVHHTNGEALDREVAAGDLIFVPAQQEHRFHSITAELVLLVIFAPAESLPG